VGPADLLSDPGRPFVDAAGNFWIERSPLEGVPQHALGVDVLGVGEGPVAAVSVPIRSLSLAGETRYAGARPAALLLQLRRHSPGPSRSRSGRRRAEQITTRQFIMEERELAAAICNDTADAVASAVRSRGARGPGRSLRFGVT
jgi:hypothetical protein